MAKSCIRWAGKWIAVNPASEHIIFENRIPKLFRTRAEARAYINEKFGYIRHRKDLRSAPHFWRLPVAVKVEIKEKF